MNSKLLLTYNNVQSEIDLYEDAFIALNFSIAEMQDISKKNVSYSKTLKVPGTSTNNIAFKEAFMISATGTFPFEYPVNVILYEDSVEIFVGYAFLTKITLGINQEIAEYEINLLSSVGSLFSDTSDKLLYGNANSAYDLNFSAYNHDLILSNIIGSWAKGGGQRSGYTYPYTSSANNSNNVGEGYVYPEINYGRGVVNPNYSNSVYSYIDGHRPAIFHKEIFDKILAMHGYTYNSSFLNSEFFKRMIWPAVTPLLLTDAAAAARNAICKNTYTDITHGGYYVTYNSTTVKTEYELDYKQMYLASGAGGLVVNGYQYVVPRDGTYNFIFEIDEKSIAFRLSRMQVSTASVNIQIPNTSTLAKVYGKIMLYRDPSAATLPGLNSLATSYSYAMPVSETNKLVAIYKNDVGYWANAPKFNATGTVYVSTGDIQCIKGDTIYPAIRLETVIGGAANIVTVPGGQAVDLKVWIEIDTEKNPTSLGYGSKFTVTGKGGVPIQEEDPVDVTQVLGVNMKQAEYIQSLSKTFNLIIEEDKTKPKHLLIEPRNYIQTNGVDAGYYSTGNAVDWSDKLDLSKELLIEPASDLLRKNIKFTWKEDEDIYNKSYPSWNQPYDSEARTYGDRYIKANVPTAETIKIQPLFAPTPQNDYLQNTRNQLIVPQIIDQPKDYRPRILYWAGYQYPSYQQNEGLHIRSKQNTGESFDGGSTRGYYGYAGHLNDVTGNDTLDLNWQAPSMWYTVPGGVDYRNLYYRFYATMIQEYTDEDARLVTGYFYLTGRDINSLKFNDYILVNGIYYRLNKIIDYSPNSVTKVELLKILVQANIGTDAPGMKKVIGIYEVPDKKFPGKGIELLGMESRIIDNTNYITIDNALVIDSQNININGTVIDSNGRIIPNIQLLDGKIDELPDDLNWDLMDAGLNGNRYGGNSSIINLIDSKQ